VNEEGNAEASAGPESLVKPAQRQLTVVSRDGYNRYEYAEGSDGDGQYHDGEQPPIRPVDDDFHRTLADGGLQVADICRGHGYSIETVSDEVDLWWLLHTTPARIGNPKPLLQWHQQHTRHGGWNHWCGVQMYAVKLEALQPCVRAVWRLTERPSFVRPLLHSYDGTPLVDARTADLWASNDGHSQLVLLLNRVHHLTESATDSRALARVVAREPLLCDLAGALLWHYLTIPAVARTRYATLRGWWNVYDEPPVPWDYLADVRWEDVEAVLDGHPLAAWQARHGAARVWSDAQVWERAPAPSPIPARCRQSRTLSLDDLGDDTPILPQRAA
jgi:hypothetical protein